MPGEMVDGWWEYDGEISMDRVMDHETCVWGDNINDGDVDMLSVCDPVHTI